MAAFPGALDVLTNPLATDLMDALAHHSQHGDANDAIEAIEAVLGITGSADTNSIAYKLAHPNFAGSDVLYDVKGDILVATGADAATRLPVGTNGQVLSADSTQATGVKWTSPGAAAMSYFDPASYIVYKSGANYFARNCVTGVDDFGPNTNAAQVIHDACDSLTATGGVVQLMAGTLYSSTSQIWIDGSKVFLRGVESNGEGFGAGTRIIPTGDLNNKAIASCSSVIIGAGPDSTATVTTTAEHGFGVGQRVTITGCSVGAYNGTFTITAVTTSKKFKYTITGSVPGASTGGNAQIDAAVINVAGSGCAAFGLVVDAASFAEYGINLQGTGGLCGDCNIQGADTANFHTDGPNGGLRCTMENLRLDNPGATSGVCFWVEGPDHIANNIRCTGTATNGWAMKVSGSRLQMSAGHITGSNAEAGCVLIDGQQNRVDVQYLDTGPDGSHLGAGSNYGQGHVVIEGTGNHLSALIQNATCTTATDANIVISSIVLQSGTTYRVTTASNHGMPAGTSLVGIYGVTPAGYNGEWTGTKVTNTTFDITIGSNPGAVTVAGKFSRGVTAVTLVSGTTYRFDSVAHGFNVGDAIWVVGFTPAGYNGHYLVTAATADTFDLDLGTNPAAVTVPGTVKRTTKYGLIFRLPISGGYCQGNVCDITFEGKGAGTNDAAFYYAVGFLKNDGTDATTLANFAGNRVKGNAQHVSNSCNLASVISTLPFADTIELDVLEVDNSTSIPAPWQTKKAGISSVAASGGNWTFPHGLEGIPSKWSVTPQSDLGFYYWVTVTAKNFVVHSATGAGSGTKSFSWQAQLFPGG